MRAIGDCSRPRSFACRTSLRWQGRHASTCSAVMNVLVEHTASMVRMRDVRAKSESDFGNAYDVVVGENQCKRAFQIAVRAGDSRVLSGDPGQACSWPLESPHHSCEGWCEGPEDRKP